MSNRTAVTRRYASEQELRQADLSRFDYNEMTPQEQAEMKRRFQEFMTAVKPRAGAKAAAPAKPKTVTKWTPKTVGRGGVIG